MKLSRRTALQLIGGTAITMPYVRRAKAQEEARRYAARKKREDREAEQRMTTLNQQLQDMIRQGREALGTTVEVDYMDEDEGW